MSGLTWSRSRSRNDARGASSPANCHCLVVEIALEIALEMRQECKKATAECQKAQRKPRLRRAAARRMSNGIGKRRRG